MDYIYLRIAFADIKYFVEGFFFCDVSFVYLTVQTFKRNGFFLRQDQRPNLVVFVLLKLSYDVVAQKSGCARYDIYLFQSYSSMKIKNPRFP